MAFTLSTIYKVVDKYTPIMKQMERANASFAMKQDAAYRKLRGTMSNMNNQLLAMAGGLSIGTLLYTGSRAVVQYDEALNSLSAITGITGKDFEAFKKEVEEVSSRTKKAGYETAKAFELIGSAQPELLKDAKALSIVTESAIILSKASRDELAVSAANLTGVLNQFSLGADQANRAINVLAAGSVVGAATISEVTEAMKNVGAVASSSNASVEETVALIEVLGKFQLKGAEAGTKLRGTFIKLQQAGLGYQSGQFKINDALAEAQKKMNALRTEKEKDAFVTKLFGLENVTAGKILMSNTALFEEYTKGVTGTNWATRQAEINSASFSVKLKELKARFENLIIKGNENSKALNTFGKVIGFVTNNLDKILVVIGSVIAAMSAYYIVMSIIRAATIAYNIVLGIFYATQSAVPVALGASSAALKAYAIAQKIATGVTWLFSAALWENPITWIVIGIIALVAAIVLLITKWKEIINWVKTSDSFFAKFIRAVLYPMVLAFKGIKIAIGWVVDKFAQLTEWFKQTAVFKLLIKVIQPIKIAFQALGNVFSWVWEKIKAVWEWIKKISGAAFAPIMKLIDKFSGGTQSELNVSTNEKPVNTVAASNEAQASKFEEITNNKLAIELSNKTDKKANIKTNTAKIPVLGVTN
jgi:TP901 family phage tail tape measure protein